MKETQDLVATKQPASAPVAIAAAKAVEEVRMALWAAKEFPRDELKAYERIMKACQRPSMAKDAIFKLPVGSGIEGPSVRLAELAANSWQNTQFGIAVVSSTEKSSSCKAFCWDLETNTRSSIDFEVPHWIEKNENSPGGRVKVKKMITDPIEIGRLISNHGNRYKRNAILDIIPKDVIDDAMAVCRKVQAERIKNMPLKDRIREMIMLFTEVSVTQDMIEKRIGHTIDKCTNEEVADLGNIYNSIFNQQSRRSDWFDDGTVKEEAGKPSTKAAESVAVPQDAKKVEAEVLPPELPNEKLPDDQTRTVSQPAPEVKAETTNEPDERGFAPDPKNPFVKNKVAEPKPSAMQKIAGEMKFTVWDKYKDVCLRDIPQDELLDVLSKIEKASITHPISDDWKLLHSNACTFLGRKNDLKEVANATK